MNPYWVGALVPVAITFILRTSRGRKKQRGVPAVAGGEPGYVIRNAAFDSPLETVWEGVTTLAELFESSCQKYADNLLLGTRDLVSREIETSSDGRSFEKFHLGDYQWMTYARAFKSACDVASGLARLGHARDERVAIFADTQAAWFIALQSCFRRNVTVVTIYASLGEEALCHSLNQTEATTVFCGGKELKKLVDISGQLETVKRVICMEEEMLPYASSLKASGKWQVVSFNEVQSLGEQNPSSPELPLPSDVAVIMYTSGSTGLPKGVMMTQSNLLAVVSSVLTIIPNLTPKDVYMAYLPLAHILELAAENIVVGVGCCIGYGTPLTLTDTSNKVKKGTKGDVSVLRPTLMAAVPAILDRVRDGVRRKVDEKGGISKKLFDFAYSRKLSSLNGSVLGAWGLESYLWNFLVFNKVKAVLGGRVRFLLSGGAPLSGDTQRFINICLGAPIGQGYGLTETCAGATISEVDDTSVGRVGNPLPCAYIKLIDWEEGGYLTSDKPKPRGEIVIGGSSVTLGYFKDEEKTKEQYKTDETGMKWFYTGDVGQFHDDGCLEIIDRKKDIVKLQHGEYVSLGKVEAALMGCPYLENVMVYAEPLHSYCVALVVGARGALEEWAGRAGVAAAGFAELCEKPETVKEVAGAVARQGSRARLEKFEVPKKVKVLPDPWTPESNLVTAALKLKREVIKKTFATELAALYSD